MAFKVLHEKKDCISCGACAAIAPDQWEMDEENMSQLIGGKEVGENWELEFDSDKHKEEYIEAADVCPVRIIHVKE